MVISNEALEDLVEIGSHIADTLGNPIAARRTIARLREAIRALSRFPGRGSAVEEEPWGARGCRKVRVGNYFAYYLVDDTQLTVQVIAILYARRDQMDALDSIEWDA